MKKAIFEDLTSPSNSVSISIRPDDTLDVCLTNWSESDRSIYCRNSTDSGATFSSPLNKA